MIRLQLRRNVLLQTSETTGIAHAHLSLVDFNKGDSS